jgi:phospholipid/cholesterol/gamma-HCH transport system substrate-binding protein
MIDPDAPAMPAKVTARVVDRSAIGEQYLDLTGGAVGDDQLAAGDHITVTADGLPPALDGLLRSSRDFVDSVPSDDLDTVINETYSLSRGNGEHLSRLIRTSSDFAKTADANFLVTASLINNSGTVLATQEESAQSFQSFSKDLSTLAHALAEQDSSWRKLVETSPAAAQEFEKLMSTAGQPLGELMSNLVSTAQVFGANADGIRETMIELPEGVSISYAIMGSQGLKMGLTPTFFNPLPCTKGYEGTQMRPGLDTTNGQPFNTKAGCTLLPSSGTNVRGPRAARHGQSIPAPDLRVADSLDDLMGANR